MYVYAVTSKHGPTPFSITPLVAFPSPRKLNLELVFVDAPHSAAGAFSAEESSSLGAAPEDGDGAAVGAGPRAWWLMKEEGTRPSLCAPYMHHYVIVKASQLVPAALENFPVSP